MYFKSSPKYMFIAYTIDYEDDVDFRVKFSIPFLTKKDAESYKDTFINNLDNAGHLFFAIIPLFEE